jgi:homoserine O-succinyltransferase
MRDAPARFRVPHSRCNDLPASALAAAGYQLLTRADAVGTDTFMAREARFHSLFLFLQGHPEYEAGTLLREYRRDIGRFLRGERQYYPAAPEGYFDQAATLMVDAFRSRAMRDRRDSLIRDFPMEVIEAGLAQTWRQSAVGIYRNWLGYLKEQKADRRNLIVPLVPRRRLRSNAGGPGTGRSTAG